MSDVLIVGGGVIGMMTARELSHAGMSVQLLDMNACAKESSWAGGGIVSPLYPWRYSEPVTRLATWSQSSYVHLAQQLLEETGFDPELRQKGMFMAAVDDADEALNWAGQFHRPMEQVDASFLYEKEPNLAPGVQQALWMPEVCSIRNPRLGRALRRSVEMDENITLVEESRVTGFVLEGERIVGVSSEKGEFRADKTVVCAGAWSGELLQKLNLNLPVEPVKGQMMIFKAEPGLINRVVLMGGRYLIPRNDGRILVGSTLERVGFDKQTTDEAHDSLYATALSICPKLKDYPVEYHWAGLRPGSPEGVPFIGVAPGYEGLYVNAGQHRNGLVLAPASTRLMADIVLKRRPIIDPELYTLTGRLAD
ncbi:glycine oxidase ThiO [Aliamphritea ceti]|uniref:glycine oxidase ThiO n=1 Tax=Aliamphritea ceti TaxID=1524258 RepID=UPI0021C3416D|nr:glycine oxidase ThiO [Aliamphritea ceti]